MTGPVVAVAHDWGGPVLLGWAERHRELLAGIVLTNTGVAAARRHRAARSDHAWPGPARCWRPSAPGRRRSSAPPPPCPGRRCPRPVRDAFASPYALPVRRRAVRDFVADIPLESGHPSRATLDGVVDGLADLADLPALLVWGPRDPVFSIRYLHDLRRRLPRADVQLYPRASHLVVEDAPQAATDVWDVGAEPPSSATPADRRPGASRTARASEPDRPLWDGLLDRADDDEVAIAELGPHAADADQLRRPRAPDRRSGRRARAGRGATGTAGRPPRPAGHRPDGRRVRLLAGRGGHRRRRRRTRSAQSRPGPAQRRSRPPDRHPGRSGRRDRAPGPGHADRRRRAAGGAAPTPAGHVLADRARAASARAAPASGALARRRRRRRASTPIGRRPRTTRPPSCSPPAPPVRPRASSTATASCGPSSTWSVRSATCGPAPGWWRPSRRSRSTDRPWASPPPCRTWIPPSPATLTATALAEAVAAVGATVVFASPAALRNVAATAAALTPELRRHLGGVRTLLSAGAPVPVPLLREIQALLPQRRAAHPVRHDRGPARHRHHPRPRSSRPWPTPGPAADGVCVGRPLPGVRLALDPLDATGRPAGALETGPGVTGRDLRGRRPREGPLRPAVEHPAAQRDPGRLAPHRRRRAPRRSRDGCGWRVGWCT